MQFFWVTRCILYSCDVLSVFETSDSKNFCKCFIIDYYYYVLFFFCFVLLMCGRVENRPRPPKDSLLAVPPAAASRPRYDDDNCRFESRSREIRERPFRNQRWPLARRLFRVDTRSLLLYVIILHANFFLFSPLYNRINIICCL